MIPVDQRAKKPRKFKIGVADVAEAAGVQSSVVFYNRVDMANLVEISEFVVAQRMIGKFKAKRDSKESGNDTGSKTVCP